MRGSIFCNERITEQQSSYLLGRGSPYNCTHHRGSAGYGKAWAHIPNLLLPRYLNDLESCATSQVSVICAVKSSRVFPRSRVRRGDKERGAGIPWRPQNVPCTCALRGIIITCFRVSFGSWRLGYLFIFVSFHLFRGCIVIFKSRHKLSWTENSVMVTILVYFLCPVFYVEFWFFNSLVVISRPYAFTLHEGSVLTMEKSMCAIVLCVYFMNQTEF